MVLVKGSIVRDAVTAIKDTYGESEFNRIVGLLDADSQKALKGTILPSSWLPIEVVVNLLETELKEFYHNDKSQIMKRSELITEKHLNGIYSIFIRIGTPAFILTRLARVNETYFKGVTVEPKMVGLRCFTCTYCGMEKRHEILEPVIVAFYKKAMEISGAQEVVVEFTVPMAVGDGKSEITVTWQER
jgi:hypothetical protein